MQQDCVNHMSCHLGAFCPPSVWSTTPPIATSSIHVGDQAGVMEWCTAQEHRQKHILHGALYEMDKRLDAATHPRPCSVGVERGGWGLGLGLGLGLGGLPCQLAGSHTEQREDGGRSEVVVHRSYLISRHFHLCLIALALE